MVKIVRIDISNWTKEEQRDFYKVKSVLHYNNSLTLFFILGLTLWWLNYKGFAVIVFFVNAILTSFNYSNRKLDEFKTVKNKMQSKKQEMLFYFQFRITSIIAGIICLLIIIEVF